MSEAERGEQFDPEERKATLVNQIIARCWTDAEFFVELVRNPVGVLRREGITIPPGVAITVAIDTRDHCTLVIPTRPSGFRQGDVLLLGPTMVTKSLRELAVE